VGRSRWSSSSTATTPAATIPLISFIARQKELRLLIGEDNVGPDQAHIEDVLSLARGRFGEIRLEDDNLPAIVEKRVLIPRDIAAVAAIDRTFATLERNAGASWNTLLGSGHDRARVPPGLSVQPGPHRRADRPVAAAPAPAHRDASAQSSCSHDHMDDVELGDLVGIGDLFDPLVFGTPPDDPIYKARFRAAREIYTDELAAPLRRYNPATDTPEKCQRDPRGRAPGHRLLRLPDAGLPQRQPRRQDPAARRP
jgi:hypothetical protein